MKSFLASLLALLATFLFLTSASAGELDCDDLFTQEVADFIAKDQQDLLAKLYHLATLKMAIETTNANRSVAEDFAKRWSATLREQNENQIQKLENLYQRYGIRKDIQTLSESFESANYWQARLRFDNEDQSAFILAHQLFAPQSKFNKTDAAAVWLVNTITEKLPLASAQYNRVNFSTRVAQLTGAIDQNKKISSDELREESEHLLKSLQTDLKKIEQHFLSEHAQQCSQWWQFQTSCFGEDFALNFGIPEALLTLKDQAIEFENLRLEQDLSVRFSDQIQFHLRPGSLTGESRPVAVVPIRENDFVVKEIRRRRELTEKLMSLDGHLERIQFFHRELQKNVQEEEQIYGVLDRQAEQLSFYQKDGQLLANFQLIYPRKATDRNQEGGAGLYSYSYTSALGQIFLSDHRGINVAYRVEQVKKAEEFLKKAGQLYILPVESGNYFRLKDDRFIFTTRNRLSHPEDYNFTPRRREFRELQTQIMNPEYRTADALKFVATLDREKENLMKLYQLENDDYNELARMAFGIMGNESKFGESLKYKIKERVPFLVSLAKGDYFDTSANSRGPTQIKNVPNLISQHYGVKKESLKDPEHAALATLGFLAEAMSELRAKERFHPEITPENRFDYLHYLYMGRHSEITRGTATPERNIYLRQLKAYAQTLEQIEG